MNLLLLFLMVGFSLPGLAQSKAATSEARDTVGNAARPDAVLLSLDEASIPKLFAERKGKVVLINIWATWCAPCVQEFPDLVKLHKVYARSGLEVILVSVDNPDVTESRVKPFLKKLNVSFPSFIKRSRDDTKFFNALGSGFGNAIPTTFIYDREGKQVHTLIGARTYENFEELIKPLLETGRKKRGKS